MVIGNLTKEGIRVMVFNATFNNISAISSGGQVYCWRSTRIKPLTCLKSLTNFITQTNVREYRRDNQKWRIQRNWQHRRRKKTHKHNTICVVHHYTLTNTDNVNKKRVLLQTTGGKDKPNIDFIRKSKRTSKQGTPNVKTHNKAFLDFYH